MRTWTLTMSTSDMSYPIEILDASIICTHANAGKSGQTGPGGIVKTLCYGCNHIRTLADARSGRVPTCFARPSSSSRSSCSMSRLSSDSDVRTDMALTNRAYLPTAREGVHRMGAVSQKAWKASWRQEEARKEGGANALVVVADDPY